MKEYFKNEKHIFEANVTSDFVKIGGKYNDCINISIQRDKDNFPIKAKIPHLESEPECSFDNILENIDTIDFIKASLQYVNQKFPTVTKFEFDDMSRIECGTKKGDYPPRKFDKPFSLSHFYIALNGETWYENKFGAKIGNTYFYEIYRNNLIHLHDKINMKYDIFKVNYSINEKQDSVLSKYFSEEKTWHEFFNDIPRSERCSGLFNWLETAIMDILENTFTPHGWYIDINTMPKTTMEIIEKQMKGGKITRRIKRLGKGRIKFTNKKHITRNGYIFDGEYY